MYVKKNNSLPLLLFCCTPTCADVLLAFVFFLSLLMWSSHNYFCLRLTHKRHLPSATQARRQTWKAASWDRPAVDAGLCRRTSPSSGLPSEQCWNKPQLVWFCLVFYYVKVTVLKILKLCTGIVVLTLCQHSCGVQGAKCPVWKLTACGTFLTNLEPLPEPEQNSMTNTLSCKSCYKVMVYGPKWGHQLDRNHTIFFWQA